MSLVVAASTTGLLFFTRLRNVHGKLNNRVMRGSGRKWYCLYEEKTLCRGQRPLGQRYKPGEDLRLCIGAVSLEDLSVCPGC